MEDQKEISHLNQSNLNEIDKLKLNRLKDRFSKWHIKQIDLLTFCINLTFTISIAFFGLIANKYFNKNFQDNNITFCFSLAKTILFCLVISITLGVIGLIIRLNDFKYTAKKIKSRRRIFEIDKKIIYEANTESSLRIERRKLDKYICYSTILGKITWWIFYIQIGLLLTNLWLIFLSI